MPIFSFIHLCPIYTYIYIGPQTFYGFTKQHPIMKMITQIWFNVNLEVSTRCPVITCHMIQWNTAPILGRVKVNVRGPLEKADCSSKPHRLAYVVRKAFWVTLNGCKDACLRMSICYKDKWEYDLRGGRSFKIGGREGGWPYWSILKYIPGEKSGKTYILIYFNEVSPPSLK